MLLLLLLAWRFFQTWAYSASTSMRCTNSPAEQMTSPLLVSSGTWRYPGKKKEVSFSFVRQTRSETLHILYYTGADQKTEVMWFTKRLSATLVTWKFYPEIRHLLRNMIGLSLKPRYFSLSSILRHFRTANPRQHLGLKNCFILLSLVQWFPLFELVYLTVLHTGER